MVQIKSQIKVLVEDLNNDQQEVIINQKCINSHSDELEIL